jgi:hypothetical protein
LVHLKTFFVLRKCRCPKHTYLFQTFFPLYWPRPAPLFFGASEVIFTRGFTFYFVLLVLLVLVVVVRIDVSQIKVFL